MTYVVIAIYRLVEFWRINMTKGSYSGVRCELRAAYSEPGQMDQIAVITLWMVATQIGHAFADQMYGCVDRENVKRLRKCQCNGHERERRHAGSAAPITESLTVRIPPQTSQPKQLKPAPSNDSNLASVANGVPPPSNRAFGDC